MAVESPLVEDAATVERIGCGPGVMTVGAKGTMVRAVVVDRLDSTTVAQARDWPLGALAPADLRIRPDYVGICGSDLEHLSGAMDAGVATHYPHVLGHEWTGTVVETGADVADSFPVGARVVGHGVFGGDRWFGFSSDGAMAQLFDVPAAMCFSVPTSVTPMRAALVEPLACSLEALRRVGGADAGHRCVVFGCGALGLTMVALLSRSGAEVIAVDRSEIRLATAKQLGASHGLISNADTQARCEMLLGGGADLVVECSGAPVAQAAAVDVAAAGARILFLGLAHAPAAQVSLYKIQARDLRLSSSTGAPPHIWQPALRFLGQSQLDLSPMVSRVFTIDQIDDALAAARDPSGSVKVMVTPNPDLAR